jgi:hypothetical protein
MESLADGLDDSAAEAAVARMSGFHAAWAR